jgi:hypothetical protein
VLVFQRWVADNHEIMLGYLDDIGDLTGGVFQISTDDNGESRYPAAALGDFGVDGRVGIVWSDTHNSFGGHDVHAAVFDIETEALMTPNFKLIDSSGNERWPEITRVSDGFVAGIHVEGTDIVRTAKFDPDGAPVGVINTVTPLDAAVRPFALAWNQTDGIGLVWRDRRVESELRFMYRLLDEGGSMTDAEEAGLVFGDAPDDLGAASWAASGVSLAWDTTVSEYMVAFDAVPGQNAGPIAEAEIYATRIANDGSTFDAPYRLSDDAQSSAKPRIAVADVALVVWFDNRDEYTVDTEFGGIYSSWLDCP